MQYRHEIDGLRAVAVWSVVIYHIDAKFLPGGFVGVDLFFVISGYLMSAIISRDLIFGTFSLSTFYERRVRRLLPALLLVTTFSSLFALFLFWPLSLVDYAKSLISVLAFSSNIYFWVNDNYFAASSDMKPLLHTWSLAVEEQYYLLFPLAFSLIFKLFKQYILSLLLLSAIVSYGFYTFFIVVDPMASFYLSPLRFWELLFGSVLGYAGVRYPVKSNNARASFAFLVICISLVVFNEASQLYSFALILPCAGCGLYLLYADEKIFIGRLLSNRILVGLGLISYSTYLWHQPILAFSRYSFGDSFNMSFQFVLVLLILGISFFSWKFIEQPFRDREKYKFKFVLYQLILIYILLGGYASVVLYKGGSIFKITSEEQKMLNWSSYNRVKMYREGDCFLTPEQDFRDFKPYCYEKLPQLLVWGDSHAAAFASGLRVIRDTNQLTSSACPPIWSVALAHRPNCREINNYIIGHIRERSYKKVILHANWSLYEEQLKYLPTTIRKLKSIGVDEVFILGGSPQFHPSLPEVLLKNSSVLSVDGLMSSDQSDVRRINTMISQMIAEQELEVTMLSALDVFCNDDFCEVVDFVEGEVFPIMWDYGHLTPTGAAKLAEAVDQLVRN